MRSLFDAVHAQRRAIALLFAIAVVLGAIAAARMPTSLLPEVVFPRITVIADSGELPADAMLRSVTRPLEAAVRRVPGVQEVRSTTSRGSVELNLDCAWRSDMDLTLQRVQAQLEATRARLAPGTELDARLMSPGLFPVVGFSITSNRASPAQLRDFALVVLQPELSRLAGAAEVVVQGGRRLEARITLDPVAMQARGLDAAGVAEAVRRASTLASVGWLETNAQLYLGLADGRPTDLATLSALPIPVASGPPVTLGELGHIELAEAPEFTRYRAQGREAVLVSLLCRRSASVIALSEAAHRWFEVNRGRLPPGANVEVFYDQSDLVRASAESVRDSLFVGALLAILVVILFLRSARLGIAGALALPGSIALTLIGLRLAGQSIDMMTLGGIAAAVGLVLDDGIVVVEHLAARTRGPQAVDRAHAMAEILPAMIGSSLCTLAIFLPFLWLGGVTGAFFRVLSLSMVLMLTSSFVVCVTAVPLLAALMPGVHNPEAARPDRLGSLLRRATATPFPALGVAVALGVASILLFGALGTGFLPEMDEGSLILDYVSPPGTSLAETDRMLQQVEREIAATPDVIAWSRRTGDQLGFFVTEPNTGDYVLRLKRGRRRAAEDVADDLRQRIESSQPALQIEFGSLVEDVIGDLTTNPQPIEVRVFSEDRALGQQKAREVAALLERVRGVVDVNPGIVVSGPNVSIVPTAAAARLGLGAEGLADQVAPAVNGVEVGEIIRGFRAWPVRLAMPARQALGASATLAELRVPAGPGRTVRLGDVARLRIDPGETEIARDNARTMVSVTSRLSGRDLGSAMAEIQRRVAAGVVLPADVHLQYGGLWAEQQSSFQGLIGVLLGAVALVIVILVLAFRSFRAMMAVLVVVSSSLAGVFAALLVTSATFNISSFVGAIMMVGIVSENAFFLVAAHRAGMLAGLAPRDAAERAARRRARPIVMTTLAGVAALAPLALGLGSGSALLRPLAIAVIGGFVTSAPLLLLMLPALLAHGATRAE